MCYFVLPPELRGVLAAAGSRQQAAGGWCRLLQFGLILVSSGCENIIKVLVLIFHSLMIHSFIHSGYVVLFFLFFFSICFLPFFRRARPSAPVDTHKNTQHGLTYAHTHARTHAQERTRTPTGQTCRHAYSYMCTHARTRTPLPLPQPLPTSSTHATTTTTTTSPVHHTFSSSS
jgi:hypothetical protein